MRFKIIIPLLFLLTACQAAPVLIEPLSEQGGIKTFRAGQLSYVEGMPLLRLSGEPYEMGLQYGVLMRHEMQAMKNSMFELLDEAAGERSWLARLLAPVWMKIYNAEMAKRLPDHYLEEIRGMADGSGLAYDELLFCALGAGFMDTSACTSILVRAGDKLLHGRNFDWEPLFLGRYPAIVEYNPMGRNRFTSFSFVGFPGLIQGINQHGLSLSTNIAFSLYEEGNSGMPIMFKNRVVLERAADLVEAERIYRSLPCDEAGWMITLSNQRSKTGLIIEMYDGEYLTTPLLDDYLYVHNILFNPERTGSVGASRRHTPISMAATEYNVARGDVTRRLVKSGGLKSVDEMLDYLGRRNLYGYEDLCVNDNSSINNEYTVNTLLFEGDAVYYASAPGYSGSAAMLCYDLRTRSLEKVRDAEPFMASEIFNQRLNWFERYRSLSYAHDWKAILQMTDFQQDLSPGQLLYLTQAFEKSQCVPVEPLLVAVGRQIVTHPDYALLYMLKGRLHMLSGDEQAASIDFAAALNAPINTDEYRLDALLALNKLHPDESQIKTRFRELVDELAQSYRLDEVYAKAYERMQ